MPSSEPLTDDHCACLDQVLESVVKTRDLIRKCKNCGLDVSKAEEEINAQEQLARKLKSEFFPDRH